MRIPILLSVIMIASSAGFAQQTAASAPQPTPLKVGDIAPDFSLQATTGSKVSLSEYKGKKGVVIAFFPAAFTGG